MSQPGELIQLKVATDEPRLWRSLDELSGGTKVEGELPSPADAGDEPNRRQMFKLMGASLALAGLNACTKQPDEKIVPYVRAPEEIIPGKPLFFATAMPFGGYGMPVLAESHMGRPTKIEGNPEHPASTAATCIFAQASVLDLWDPDRSQAVMLRGRYSTWVGFQAAMNVQREAESVRDGAGLRILTGTVTSPTLAKQIQDLLAAFPKARWHQWEPAGRHGVRAGSQAAFGEYVETLYRFDQAGVVLALDADFLTGIPGSIRYARDFMNRRRLSGRDTKMNRLYAVEPAPTSTGACADHRLALASRDVESFARAVAARLGVAGVEAGQGSWPAAWLDAVVADLQANRGTGIVLAGDQQSANVHALAHAINHALGNAGKTVVYSAPVEANPVDQVASIRDLTADMKAGRVETLLILGGNPAYDAPADLEFTAALGKVKFRVHQGPFHDETADACLWHIPETHYLESWGDVRAYEGTASIVQPLIAPLYGGRSAHEVLAAFLGKTEVTAYEMLRAHWRSQAGKEDFEKWWRKALHDGFIPNTAAAVKTPSLKLNLTPRDSGTGTELNVRPDPTIWDGRFANNGWLQELPKPLSKLTWDNAAMVSPAMAERLGVSDGEVVEIAAGQRTVRAPIWLLPGHADDSVTVHLGYGRRSGGKIAPGQGFDAYALRTTTALWHTSGVQIRKTGARHALASTQEHHSMEGRKLVRTAALPHYQEHPDFAQHLEHVPAPDLTLYPPYEYKGYKWGLAIDTHSCIGCNACTIACQAENNIAVVGKAEVLRGRELHWIRLDRYFEGNPANPQTHFQPVTCMQCENAPCEIVCPVTATAHSEDGINQMVYNRCIGTRYCSNNCPYKVRRFNFFLYSDWTSASLEGLRNPDVTVRSRGVMEKCTYCVQRISAAKIDSEKQDRRIRDGEVLTACQQVCPTEAIVFGDLNDPASRVAKLAADSRNYALLGDLNTRPRTTYLAKVRNPNPQLEAGAGSQRL